MRWVYAAPGRAAEWKRRVATVAAIDRWWAAFRDRSQALLGSLNPETLGFELVPFMREHLHAVHPELCWEFGPGVEGAQRRLTIAPEAKRHLLPVVETILEGAPDLPGWSFHSDRIREDPAHAVELVRQRYGLELAEFSFEVNAGDMGVLEVMVAAPEGVDDDQAFSATYLALATILGERDFFRWVGPLHVGELPSGGCSIDALQASLDDGVRVLTERLPRDPFHTCIETAGHSVLEGQPPQPEGGWEPYGDIYMAVTAVPEALLTRLRGLPFDSGRFSRNGETFCSVVVQGFPDDPSACLEARRALSDALDAALRPRALGCPVGGASGVAFAYVELALVDVPASLDVIRAVSHQQDLSDTAWVLFHDDTHKLEWVGLTEWASPPPGFG